MLETVETTHIHLETVELWMMDEPKKFQTHVEACLRAFDLAKRGVVPSTLPSTPEVTDLTIQTQIEFPKDFVL